MKPLTIEQLKALEVGDWVWLVQITEEGNFGLYTTKTYGKEYEFPSCGFTVKFLYSDYGTKWLAYKNKEQAETKGEIVELPVLIDHCVPTDIEGSFIYIKELFYKSSSGYIETRLYYEDEFEEAERRLAELKGEKV